MSLLFKRATLSEVGVPSRVNRKAGSVTVTGSSAMTHSAVWACIRLRAGLLSSLPIDEFQRIGGVQREVPKDEFLNRPGALFIGGSRSAVDEWLYATQSDLDRFGNTFGLQSRDGLGRIQRVDLLPAECVTVSVRNGVLQYRVEGKLVDTLDIWHERQYVVAGLPVGLSPVAYGAMTLGQYLSAQQFALDWFTGGAVPQASLKNTAKKISGPEAATVKERWKAAVSNGDLAVLGADWDYQMISAVASQSEFLATQEFSVADACRFFDVPGDMIDADSSTGKVTYASITQRNLQLLVINLGPTIVRRERAVTETRRPGHYVKLNTDALLRMDPKAREEMLKVKVETRSITPNEIRELDNRPPLSPADEAEFARLFPTRAAEPMVAKSEPVALTVHSSPVEVDARTEVHPSKVEVDARTEVAEGAITASPVTNDSAVISSTVAEALAAVVPEAVRQSAQPMVELLTERDAARIDQFAGLADQLTAASSALTEAAERSNRPRPLIRKRVETDETGRITAVVEEEI